MSCVIYHLTYCGSANHGLCTNRTRELSSDQFEVPVVEITQDSKTIGNEDKSIPGFQITFQVMLGLLLLLLLFSMRGNKK
jgi:hypothetical protein